MKAGKHVACADVCRHMCTQVVTDCSIYLKATEEDLDDYAKEMAAKRCFPETKPDGTAWKFRDACSVCLYLIPTFFEGFEALGRDW